MAACAPAIILALAIVTNGLLAGLFFVFTVAVSPGFQHIDDHSYVRAFRAINMTIQNGWFLSVFFAAPLSAAASAVMHWRDGAATATWIIVGAICSALTFGITAAANVPLNRELDQAPIGTEQQRRITRGRFEARWNRWNLARTLTSIGSIAFLATSATW